MMEFSEDQLAALEEAFGAKTGEVLEQSKEELLDHAFDYLYPPCVDCPRCLEDDSGSFLLCVNCDGTGLIVNPDRPSERPF